MAPLLHSNRPLADRIRQATLRGAARFIAERVAWFAVEGIVMADPRALTHALAGRPLGQRNGSEARVSLRISLDSSLSRTIRDNNIAPTMADQAAMAARRFSGGVRPVASALR